MRISDCFSLSISASSLLVIILLYNQQSFCKALEGSKMFNYGRSNDNSILCGQSATIPLESYVPSRIYGGRIARPGELPFQVHLKSQDEKLICSGVIIDETTVLTAAHCFIDRSSSYEQNQAIMHPLDEFRLLIGDHDRLDPSDNQMEIAIDKVIVHPKYKWNWVESKDYDIAVLKTKLPMTWRLTRNGFGSVNRICMPLSEIQDYKIGDIATLSGWGRFKNNSDEYSHILRLVDIVIVEPTADNAQGYGQIYGSTFDGKDSCQGDSGGPLFLKRRAHIGCNNYDGHQCNESGNQMELIGLVSYGTGCALNIPATYTSISKHFNWIQKFRN